MTESQSSATVPAPDVARTSDGPIIHTQALARWYGPVVGITDVTVKVPPGIIGLLGPNGAGKSTLMRLFTGQIYPSSGDALVLGQRPWRSPELFQDLGFCSEDDALYDELTPLEMVAFLGRCSGYSRTEARERAERAIERAGIAHARNRRCGGFSKGMRQRTRIAAALVHDPKLVLLDEPMTGLDPVGRRAVMDMVGALAAENKTVVFASHILHEVEAIAQHVVVINKGMVLAEGTLAEIQEELRDYAFTLEVRCDAPRRLAGALVELAHVRSVAFVGSDGLRVATASAHSLVTELPGVSLDRDVAIHEISAPDESLENLFEKLVK